MRWCPADASGAGELQRVALAEPLEQLQGIAALLERQKSLKRCRHLLEAWGGQRLQTLESCIMF